MASKIIGAVNLLKLHLWKMSHRMRAFSLPIIIIFIPELFSFQLHYTCRSLPRLVNSWQSVNLITSLIAISLTFILAFISRCHCCVKGINFVSVCYCCGSEDFPCCVDIIIIKKVMNYTFLFFIVFVSLL
jgi:hypothetical protein